MRPAILFAALVVMATAGFADANAWFEPLPAIRKLPLAARIALMYVPYVILIGVLWIHGRVQSRVRGHIGWFIALALAAAGVILTPYAMPVLMLLAALVLLRLAPREGLLYEAKSFPSIRAFLGLSLFAAMSLRWGADLFGLEWAWYQLMPNLPRNWVALGACAIAVAAFIAFTGVRHRKVQPCGAALWLAIGIGVFVAAEAASHLPSNLASVFFAMNALFIASHAILFIGAFLLLSHLLPVRDSDHAH